MLRRGAGRSPGFFQQNPDIKTCLASSNMLSQFEKSSKKRILPKTEKIFFITLVNMQIPTKRPGVLPHTPLTYSTYTAQLLCGVLVMGFISVISYRGCTTADKEQLSTCKCTATCTFLQNSSNSLEEPGNSQYYKQLTQNSRENFSEAPPEPKPHEKFLVCLQTVMKTSLLSRAPEDHE
ncbi:hypothetical protein Anapl_08627 [Anas platyrhynchos]|uniref:Uncharacterized protein n=1 Tax=Anas platyrhynchos TaxID=8839 RepID=R0M1F8_ANAPL|nr:hypothetical protein Anapl_08627 [Anas platyrhynchos]